MFCTCTCSGSHHNVVHSSSSTLGNVYIHEYASEHAHVVSLRHAFYVTISLVNTRVLHINYSIQKCAVATCATRGMGLTPPPLPPGPGHRSRNISIIIYTAPPDTRPPGRPPRGCNHRNTLTSPPGV